MKYIIKKKFLFALSLIISFNIITKAYDCQVEGLYYNIVSLAERQCELTHNEIGTYSGDIIIPSSIKYEDIEFSVVSIGSETFMNCYELSTLSIPSSVTYIAEAAFNNCYGLKKLILQDTTTPIFLTYNTATNSSYKEGEGTFVKSSLQEIYIGRPIDYAEKANCGYSPFYKLKSLKRVVFSENVTTFGTRCFYGCNDLSDIIFSNSIETISNFSFSGCTALKELNFNEGLKSIGSEAFRDCTSLISINLPSTLVSLNSSFRNCTALESIEIPESTLDIGNYTFCGCSSLQYIKLPVNLSIIPQSLFQDCLSLEDIDLPSKINSLEDYSFMGCSSLKGINIPDPVTNIGSNCFANCTSLTELILPKNVSNLRWNIIDGCAELKSLYLLPLTPPSCVNGTFSDGSYVGVTLYVVPESYELYKTTTPWSNFLNIKEFDQAYADDIFYDDRSSKQYYNLKGINIPNPSKGIFIEVSNGKSKVIHK